MLAQQAEVICTTSEQLGEDVFVKEPFWKPEDNGTMIVHELWKGAGVQECVNVREMSGPYGRVAVLSNVDSPSVVAARRPQPI